VRIIESHEPYVVEFSAEELAQVELALEEVHYTQHRQLAALFDAVGLPRSAGADESVCEIAHMLAVLEPLEVAQRLEEREEAFLEAEARDEEWDEMMRLSPPEGCPPW
jgi:hypothetical protein